MDSWLGFSEEIYKSFKEERVQDLALWCLWSKMNFKDGCVFGF